MRNFLKKKKIPSILKWVLRIKKQNDWYQTKKKRCIHGFYKRQTKIRRNSRWVISNAYREREEARNSTLRSSKPGLRASRNKRTQMINKREPWLPWLLHSAYCSFPMRKRQWDHIALVGGGVRVCKCGLLWEPHPLYHPYPVPQIKGVDPCKKCRPHPRVCGHAVQGTCDIEDMDPLLWPRLVWLMCDTYHRLTRHGNTIFQLFCTFNLIYSTCQPMVSHWSQKIWSGMEGAW